VVIDLTEVTIIDSCRLAVLRSGICQVRTAGGEVCLRMRPGPLAGLVCTGGLGQMAATSMFHRFVKEACD
jgi:anti-anti-sigma regulatory factor